MKVGDKVMRINYDNGSIGAKVGQEATIISFTKENHPYVTYEGYKCKDFKGQPNTEIWYKKNCSLVSSTIGQSDSQMNIQEAYKVMQDNCGIEVGDYVKVLRKAQNHENGWKLSWKKRMDIFIGNTLEVLDKNDDWGFQLSASDGFYGYYHFPFFVLELVEKGHKPKKVDVAWVKLNENHTAIVKKDNVRVGCQVFSFDSVESLYQAVQEVKEK